MQFADSFMFWIVTDCHLWKAMVMLESSHVADMPGLILWDPDMYASCFSPRVLGLEMEKNSRKLKISGNVVEYVWNPNMKSL